MQPSSLFLREGSRFSSARIPDVPQLRERGLMRSTRETRRHQGKKAALSLSGFGVGLYHSFVGLG
jgi:hypothetical protein